MVALAWYCNGRRELNNTRHNENMGDGIGSHLLELTELADHPQKYDLGENEFHLAFETDDIEEALSHHKAMDCVCYENPHMGIYFIEDPDGYWLEVTPKR
jgi:lactoylglutathione lyase